MSNIHRFPAIGPRPRIVVQVESGAIQDITSDVPITALVIDYDVVSGMNKDEVSTVPPQLVVTGEVPQAEGREASFSLRSESALSRGLIDSYYALNARVATDSGAPPFSDPLAPSWTEQNSASALQEGWVLTNSSKDLHTICMFDEDPQKRFSSDAEAAAFVVSQAAKGSPLHRKALSLVGLPFGCSSDEQGQVDFMGDAWTQRPELMRREQLITALECVNNIVGDYVRSEGPDGYCIEDVDATAESALVGFMGLKEAKQREFCSDDDDLSDAA